MSTCCSGYGRGCESKSRSGRSGVCQDPRTADDSVGEACACVPGQNHVGHVLRLWPLIGRLC